jgi:glycosyltransferase involved in cell wall biosynthesis
MASLSILLPVFNGSKFLKGAIESALKQSFTDWEMIAVDDGSTDNSVEILEGFAARDERIKIFKNDHNLGLFENYNRCYELATGEYIKPFAQDDLLMPNNLEKAVSVLRKHPEVSLVLSARDIIDENDNVIEMIDPFKLRSCSSKKSELFLAGRDLITWSLIYFNNHLGEPVVGLFRKASITTPYDTKYGHIGDLELWFRLLEQGNACYLADKLCNYRRHSAQASAQKHRELIDLVDWLRLSKQYYSYLKAIGESEEHLQNRLIEVAALNVNHHVKSGLISSDTFKDRSPGYSHTSAIALDQEFSELLFLALRRITPLIAKLDDQKQGLTELPILKARLNSRSHRFIGAMLHVVKRFQSRFKSRTVRSKKVRNDIASP